MPELLYSVTKTQRILLNTFVKCLRYKSSENADINIVQS